MSDSINNSKLAVQSQTVAPLPISSGGDTKSGKDMNNMNTQLTMLSAQANADAKFDPPSSSHASKQVVSHFCSGPTISFAEALGIVGGVLIVYGIIAK